VTVFRFALTIEGADILTHVALDALYEAGCDDATFGLSSGVQTGEFDRKAADFAEAVASAIKASRPRFPGPGWSSSAASRSPRPLTDRLPPGAPGRSPGRRNSRASATLACGFR
jgi:hypothetical protein